MSFLTGKPGTSIQNNQAYPYLQGAYGGQVGMGTQANSALGSLLGLGGASDPTAFNNYKNSAGFQSTLDAGSQAITGNNASRGLLQSGATGKALTNFGQQTNQNFFQQYLGNLLGLSGQGLQAGELIGNAGAQKNETGATQGLGAFFGSLASKIPGV